MDKKPQTALQKAYQKFFNEKLRKYNVSSPANIKDKALKSRFFNEIAEDWQKRRRRIKDPQQLKTPYTNQYLAKVKRRFSIPKNMLESGMLIELKYTTVTKDGTKNTPKKFFVLVLHPNWKKYMHALRLDKVAPRWTRELVESVGLEQCTYNAACERLKVKQLLLEEKDSKRFYIKELKPFMEKKYNNSYRTFRIDRFVVTSLFHFNFSDF